MFNEVKLNIPLLEAIQQVPSYAPPKEMVNSSFEDIYEDELKILGIHVVYAPIVFFDDDDEFMRSGRGKKSRRKLRKLRNKLERMNIKMTKK